MSRCATVNPYRRSISDKHLTKPQRYRSKNAVLECSVIRTKQKKAGRGGSAGTKEIFVSLPRLHAGPALGLSLPCFGFGHHSLPTFTFEEVGSQAPDPGASGFGEAGALQFSRLGRSLGELAVGGHLTGVVSLARCFSSGTLGLESGLDECFSNVLLAVPS